MAEAVKAVTRKDQNADISLSVFSPLGLEGSSGSLLIERTSRVFDQSLDFFLRTYHGTKGRGNRLQTYMAMRRHPMISLGLNILKAPILAQDWRIEGSDESINNFVEKAIRPIWYQTMRSALKAIEYGYMPHELIYTIKDVKVPLKGRRSKVFRNMIVPKWAKPLIPYKVTPERSLTGEITAWRVEDQSARSGYVLLPPEKVFIPAWDDEFETGIGVSILEGIREAWTMSSIGEKLYGRYIETRAVRPLIGYAPFNNIQDPRKQGTYTSGQQLMLDAMQNMRHGNGTTLPNLRDAKGEPLWWIKELEISEAGDQFEDFLHRMDQMILRGLMTLDRVVISGRNGGSQAETQTMTETTFLLYDTVLKWLEIVANQQIIAPMLEVNDLEKKEVCLKINRLRPSARTSLLRNILATVSEAVNETPDGKKFTGKDALDIKATLEYLGLPSLSNDRIQEMLEDEPTAPTSPKTAKPEEEDPDALP